MVPPDCLSLILKPYLFVNNELGQNGADLYFSSIHTGRSCLVNTHRYPFSLRDAWLVTVYELFFQDCQLCWSCPPSTSIGFIHTARSIIWRIESEKVRWIVVRCFLQRSCRVLWRLCRMTRIRFLGATRPTHVHEHSTRFSTLC